LGVLLFPQEKRNVL